MTCFVQRNETNMHLLEQIYTPMNHTRWIAVLLLIFTTHVSFAQDMILKRNNEIIHCKIIEVGLDDIKYRLPEYPDDVSFAVAKDQVSKIVFENGSEMEFSKELTNAHNYEDNKRNALKLDFLSPITGNTSISYERNLKPGRSIEGTLGFIGLGLNTDDRNAGGVFIKAGYKFIKDPDFYLRGMQYTHLLKGAYLKPELMLGFYAANEYYWIERYDSNGYWFDSEEKRVRGQVFSGALHLVLGKQWIIDNAFLIDFYSGIGYGFQASDKPDSDYYYSPATYHYGYTVGEDVPISFSVGLKIGFLFK
jgi:hypothetical protein